MFNAFVMFISVNGIFSSLFCPSIRLALRLCGAKWRFVFLSALSCFCVSLSLSEAFLDEYELRVMRLSV